MAMFILFVIVYRNIIQPLILYECILVAWNQNWSNPQEQKF